MRRQGGKLSPKEVQHARPVRGRRATLFGDGLGLYLQATSGADGGVRKSWVFRYEQNGVRRDMGLGALHTISLSEARAKARTLRQMLLDGVNPLAAKRAQRNAQRLSDAKAMTFGQCVDAYLAAHEKSWKNSKHRGQWRTTLETYAYPIIGDLPVAEIDLPLVIKVIEPHWDAKRETMSRLRGRIAAILDWATVRNYRVGDNPAAWRGRLEHLLSPPGKAKGHAALPWSEVPEFMARLRASGCTDARALEFLILTAARTGEVLGAEWDEIDLAEAVWTVPAARTKAGREHRVPLSGRAVELLEGLPRSAGSRRVFDISNNAMLLIVGSMRPGVTAHGFRSSFRDWAGERTHFPREVAEAALAHVVGDATERAYRRGDALEKRRALMEQWSTFCANPPAEGAVVPLRKAGI